MGDVCEELNRLAERIANVVGFDNLENTALDAIEADLRSLAARGAPSPRGARNPNLCPSCKTWPVDGDACPNCGRAKPFGSVAPQPAGDHGGARNSERATRETLVPCDCGCGRSCCANCGADLGFLQAPPEPAPSAPADVSPEREAMSRMKDAAIEAHRLCYEAMKAHPDIATLGDDGELHKAIHAIVGVETPSYVAPADVEALALIVDALWRNEAHEG